MANPRNSTHCIDPHDRIDALENRLNDLVINGAAYTPGCGIAIDGSNQISAAVDDITVKCIAGLLTATAGSYSAGCGIDITGGVLSVRVDNTSIECSGGVLRVMPNAPDLYAEIRVAGQATLYAAAFQDYFIVEGTGGISILTNEGAKKLIIDGSGIAGGGGGGNRIMGTLAANLKTSDATVTVNVTRYQGSNPGATVVCNNPVQTLFNGARMFLGNAGGVVTASEYNDGWWLDTVQPPRTAPT